MQAYLHSLIVACVFVAAACGFTTDAPMYARTAGPRAEAPIVNLPEGLREWNWGGGSCVHASQVMEFRWCNNLELAKWWREHYSGGESFNGLTEKLRKAKIPYYATARGDVAALERCMKDRRGAVIFYYTNHSIMLCHLDEKRAIVLDNNRIDYFIEIPRDEFLRNWKGFGGVAVTATIGEPAPPLPYVDKKESSWSDFL
jgi:hypothetical protein